MSFQTRQLEIGHDFNNDGGRYWAEVEGGSAELTYRVPSSDVMIIDHTYVPPQSRGRDIALQLVRQAINDAVARELKIRPDCQYVHRVLQMREEFSQVQLA